MKYYLLEKDEPLEMSEARAMQLSTDGTIIECPYHRREFAGPVKTYHLTHGPAGLGMLDLVSLTRDVS